MSAISKALASSLDHLSESIRLAESFLANIPNAVGESVRVREDSIFDSEVGGFFKQNTWLEFGDGEDGRAPLLQKVLTRDDDNAELSAIPLMELPIKDRLQFAKYIPRLIKAVVAAQEKFPKEVMEASAEIRKAIEAAK